MTAAGVICEYNPFHSGHLRQFAQLRERLGADTAIVCLMSGAFVQRGEVAVFSPAVRAAAAVECGADIVLELPVTHSLRSAEGFAAGGVDILTRLGAVDGFFFGAEHADETELLRTAKILCSAEYDAALRELLQTRVSYPAARERALIACGGDGALLRRPNDILAAEYCKAIVQQKSALQPLVLPRGGDYHALDADAENPSATAVRALYPDGNWRALVPEAAAALYAGAERFTMAAGERAMLARLRGMAKRDWECVPYGSEGLWSAVYKAVQRAGSVEEIIDSAKSKRYVRTRLQRLLLCAYLGLTADELARPAEFVRVLALSARGGRLLRRIRETSSVLCLNAGARAPEGAQAELEARCAGLSTLFSTGTNAPAAALAQKGRVYRRKI